MQEINEITYKIRAAIFSVFNELGPGLFESVYETVLAYELREIGLIVQTQVPIPVHYKEIKMEIGFRADIIVNDKVIIEIKSIETLHNVHKKQLLTYLKLTDKRIGILVNFNVSNLVDRESLIRIIN